MIQKYQSRKFKTVLFIGLIIDETLYRNSTRDPHARQFFENGNVATRPIGSAVLNPEQMLSAPVHSRTLHRRFVPGIL